MSRFPKLLTGLFRDFRNSYNEGVDKIDAEFDLQKKRVDDLIKGSPQPSEVVDARGGHPVLRDRLNQVDALMAQIVTLNVESFKTPSNTYHDAITAAFNQVSSIIANTFKIIFPNKEITITAGFNVKSNMIIDLNGCTLKKANGEDFHVFSTKELILKNVVIKNGTIDGNASNVTGTTNGRVLALNDSQNENITVDNVKILNNKSYNITIANAVDVTIQNCKLISELEDNISVGMLIYYPDKPGNKRVRILNNYLFNLAGDNIVIGGSPTYRGSDCIISGNIVEKPCSKSTSGNRLGAIQCEGGSAQNDIGFENIIITENIVKNLDSIGTQTDGIMVASGKNVIISDNIVNGTTWGITSTQSENVNIANNITEKTKNEGVILSYVRNVANVNNNSIISPNFGTIGASAGIRYYVANDANYSLNNVMINNNYILLTTGLDATTRGIWIWVPTTLTQKMGNLTIKDNEIDNRLANAFGIKIEGATNLNIDIDGNRGWRTKNSGLAIMPTGTDVVSFDHGLPTAPTLVNLTGFGIESTDLYVSSLTWSSNKQIRVKNKTVVAADATIYWTAELKY